MPPRPPDTPPVEFRKTYKTPDGKTIFQAGQIYLRQAHESVPASTSDDFQFLMNPQRLHIPDASSLQRDFLLDHNIPPRDGDLYEFVGRYDEIDQLWRWFSDRYNPVRILTGMGGVGKTTIARVFAEQIVEQPPTGLEKIVWLSAKQSFFVPTSNTTRPTLRIDFVDQRSMLIGLLNELGGLPDHVDDDADLEELIDETVTALSLFPSLIIVDDVDSLAVDQQYEILDTLLMIVSRAATARTSSRILVTSRLDLGAGTSRLIRVRGFPLKEFYHYVRVASDSLEIHLGLEREAPLMRRFHSVTQGSPIFALSVLRLVNLGERLDVALTRWKDADGLDVRRFVFERELNNLTESQLRTLYALTLLKNTSLVELQQVTKSPDTRLSDDVGELRKYHLLSFDTELAGGAQLIAPAGICLMSPIIQSKIRDPKRVERSCHEARKSMPETQTQVGQFIHRAVALWKEDRTDEAFQVAKYACGRIPKSADLKCLLGRAYLRLTPPRLKDAEIALREADRLGCKRSELVPLWLEARCLMRDWIGVIELTYLAEKREGYKAEYTLMRGQANFAIAEMENETGSLASSAQRLLETGLEIDRVFSEGVARGNVYELRELRGVCLNKYVRLLSRANNSGRDGLEVWLGCVSVFRAFVRNDFVIRTGIDRLEGWWTEVRRDERFDQRALEAAERAVHELDEMLDVMSAHEIPNGGLIDELRRVHEWLARETREYLGLLRRGHL